MNQILIKLKIETNKSPNIHPEVHKMYCTSKEMRRERLHLCRERDRKRASEKHTSLVPCQGDTYSIDRDHVL